MRKLLLIPAVMALILQGANAAALRRHVDIKAPDGIHLKGSVYSTGLKGPAILLLHQCNSDRSSWESLAASLVESGINVMTLDFRGYGQSEGKVSPGTPSRASREKWPGDVEAAWTYFVTQPEIDSTRVAAGGASCGADQALTLAGNRKEITALVLLSGVVRAAGLSFLDGPGAPPVFAAVSGDDVRSARDMRAVVDASAHPGSLLKVIQGAGHGVPMFDKEPELIPSIVSWVVGELVPPPPEGESR